MTDILTLAVLDNLNAVSVNNTSFNTPFNVAQNVLLCVWGFPGAVVHFEQDCCEFKRSDNKLNCATDTAVKPVSTQERKEGVDGQCTSDFIQFFCFIDIVWK